MVAVQNAEISITNSTFERGLLVLSAIKVCARGKDDGTNPNDITGAQASIKSLTIEGCTFSGSGNQSDIALGVTTKNGSEPNKSGSFPVKIVDNKGSGENGALGVSLNYKGKTAEKESVSSGGAYVGDGTADPVAGYTITTTASEGGTINPSGKVAVAENGSQDFTVIANSGYSISSVTVDGGAIVERKAEGTYTVKNVTKNCTVTATFSKNSSSGGGGSVTTKYTLTFDTNGGSAIAKVTKEKGTTVDLGQYVPTREGYTFAGWYSDEALTQKVTSVKLNGNTTVYAKWTENAVTPTLPFTDVKSGDWFYEAVQYVYDKGMMTGVSADRFAPASTTTRGMIVTILYRLENEPAVSGGSAFTDVESGAWYADAVAWAAANDIVNGTSATTFAPNSPITREQMAAILYRYAAYKGYDVSQKADLSGYTDAASISGYAKDALAWANAQKLITGVTDTTLNPQGSATRAQVATILMRLCETVVK